MTQNAVIFDRLTGAGARTDAAFWRARQNVTTAPPDGGSIPSWVAVVEAHLPPRGARALEVGVVPGHMLLHLARSRGYACTGIDFSPAVHGVARAFERQGAAARFIETDFLTWDTDERFDLVYSCGFIEHFDDPAQVIERHWRVVSPGGLMVISVPVLSPYQYAIRKLTYTRAKFREVLDTHNLSIMRLGALKRAVGRCAGARVVAARYTREMTVWFGPRSPGVRGWTAPVFRMVRPMESLMRRVAWSSALFSPEVVVAAVKG